MRWPSKSCGKHNSIMKLKQIRRALAFSGAWHKRWTIITAAICSLEASFCASYAAIIFDNLTQKDSGHGQSTVSASYWQAQGFNSGSADLLTSVTLNLYRISSGYSGNYAVWIYDQTGDNHEPGAKQGTVTSGQSISALSEANNSSSVFSGLSIELTPSTDYYVVVGGEASAAGLEWGYALSAAGTGLPSRWSYTITSGSDWSTPSLLEPQIMQLEAVPEPFQCTILSALGLVCFATVRCFHHRVARRTRPHAPQN